MMKIILFPTDFSKNAAHAFNYARLVAQKRQAKIILFHTYEVPIMAPANAFQSREETMRVAEENLIESSMNGMAKYTEALNAIDASYQIVLREGNASQEIIKFCKQVPVDLIVMGTKGESNHRDFLIGSITNKVSQGTSTPLLAIPESTAITPFEKIVFATDLLYNTEEDYNNLVEFAATNDAQLTFLHLDVNNEEHTQEIQDLSNFVKMHPYDKLNFIVRKSENVVVGLDQFLKKEGADIMALSNHTKSLFDRLFHKSITKEMILHAQVPLLIFSKEVHPVVFF